VLLKALLFVAFVCASPAALSLYAVVSPFLRQKTALTEPSKPHVLIKSTVDIYSNNEQYPVF